jgi:hypothetical protein
LFRESRNSTQVIGKKEIDISIRRDILLPTRYNLQKLSNTSTVIADPGVKLQISDELAQALNDI